MVESEQTLSSFSSKNLDLSPERKSRREINSKEIQIVSNSLLLQVTEYIAESEIDSGEMLAYVVRKSMGITPTPPAIHGMITEYHIVNAFNRFFAIEGIPEALVDGRYETDRFELYPSPKNGALVAEKRTPTGRETVTDFDFLAMVGGLMTDFEVKVARDRTSEIKANEIMSAQRIQERLSPLQDVFGINMFGYVLFVVSDMRNALSKSQIEFEKRGGILRVLKPEYLSFWDEAIRIYSSIRHASRALPTD
jgi:hypothetical protein